MRLRWISVLLFIMSGLIALPLLVFAGEQRSWGTEEPVKHPAPPHQARQIFNPPSASSPNSGIFEDNLLTNPSFEGGFYTPPESFSSLVAPGWSIWFNESRPTDHIPEWNEEVLLGQGKLSWRVRHGDKTQKMFSSFSTHQGGFYQQVDVVPGTELEFSIWVEVWSSDCDKNCVSPLEPGVVCPSQNTHGDYRVSVGIDPTGGTDPLAPTIHWERYRLPWDISYDVWNRLVVTDTAQASQVTVFTEGWAEYAVKHNDSYWEDAKLAYVTPLTTTPAPQTTTPELPTATLQPQTTTPEPPKLPNNNYIPLVLRNSRAAPVGTSTPPITLTPTVTATAAAPTVTGTPSPTGTAVAPTVTPTTQPACDDLIQNGDFEAEGGWTFQSGVPYPPDYDTDPAGADRVLRLGIPPESDNRESWSAAWQALALPATLDSATLTFAYFPESTDLERDYFEVRLLDQAGAPIGYLIHPLDGQSNDQDWLPVQFDLTAYAGRTIQIYFNVYNDGRNGQARVYLDDVRVEVCGAMTQGINLHSINAEPPQLRLLQDVPFGQVHFTWARYGKHTPNVNWTDCQNPTDVEVEWVQLINDGDAVNLEGWILEDGDGNVFTLPSFTLGAGEKLRIWTDDRDNGPNDLFLRRTEPVWNDDADRATLRFPNGDLATGSLCWYEVAGSPIACLDENP
jgi:hypothetical protein